MENKHLTKEQIEIIHSLATSYMSCKDNKVMRDFYDLALSDILILLDIDLSPDEFNNLISKEYITSLATDKEKLDNDIQDIFGWSLEEHKLRILLGHLKSYFKTNDKKHKEFEKNILQDILRAL